MLYSAFGFLGVNPFLKKGLQWDLAQVTVLSCGIDFGTTNSSAALVEGGKIRVLELDPFNDKPTSLPSLLYIPREGDVITGRNAADAFIERNVGREVLLKQVTLETSIEGYVGGEGDNDYGMSVSKNVSDVREAVRARAVVEVNSPGRLFQSLKTSLRHRGYTGTQVFGEHYQIEELVARLLTQIKARIDAAAGEAVTRAVLGCPVRFSRHDDENATAQRRLETAARIAGFKEVTFFYEPVAACVEYAIEVQRKQRLMVVDIGGGTCDVCLMEFGGAHGAAERLAESRILGVAGLPIAGDAIDREIIRAKLFASFGSRARYGPNQLPMPQYISNTILDWQGLYRLNTEEIINWLIAAEPTSTDPQAIRALRTLIQKNYGYPVARETEYAKKRLSEVEETTIEIHHEHIAISERLERSEFSHLIEEILEQIEDCLKEAESAAQIKPSDIDYVLTTGGTCLIPAIREMLVARYTQERLQQRDTFTSVASGLALVAQYA